MKEKKSKLEIIAASAEISLVLILICLFIECFFFFFNNDGETARNFHIVHFFCLLFLFLFLLFFHIFHSFYHPLIHVLIQMRESILFFAPLTMGNFLQGCEFLNEEFTLGFVNGSRVWTL